MRFRLVKLIFCAFILSTIILPAFAGELNENPVNPVSQNKPKIFTDENAMQAEMDFYVNNDAEAELIFNSLKTKKDHDVALWSNQLGSLYLAQGKNKEAQMALMDAYLVMNNITAFKDLELRSVGLMGAEATKAYKGDPYEKVFNSFYVGMLLCADNDFENSLAAFKNGILCDSDVESNLYKSDVALLYLMASRVEALQKNQSMADDYFKQAQEAYYLSYPDNRPLVSQEQSLLDDLSKKQKALSEKEAPYKNGPETKKPKKMPAQTEKEINTLSAEISKLETEIKTLADNIEANNRKIIISSLRDLVNLNNNTLLCIETGRAPFKYQTGTYGEKAVFTIKPSKISGFKVTLDNFIQIQTGSFLKNNDIYYQASTRGGRAMDSILKGKADFKKTTADVSNLLSGISQAYDPYGVLSIFSLASGAISQATNPYADARHWSLLPAEIQIVPLHLNPGKHQLQIEAYDSAGKILQNYKTEIEITDNPNNVIFKRFRENSL